MKKINLLLTLILLVGCQSHKTYNDPYNREAAVAYALQYVFERNDEYISLETNCTNYVSQVLVAGGKQMDEVSQPIKDKRVTYNDNKDYWYSTYMWSNHDRWKEFNVSTAFVRTDDFVNYWKNIRNMKYYECNNSPTDLVNIYEYCELGDVIVLLNEDDDIEHLCVITKINESGIFVSANTLDFLNRYIEEINSDLYPRMGLIKIV